VTRDHENGGLRPGRLHQRSHTLADPEIDGLDRLAEACGSSCVVPGLVGIEKVPELVTDTVGLPEGSGEEIPAFAAQQVEQELRLALGSGEERVQ
jgi:hypothetical protein